MKPITSVKAWTEFVESLHDLWERKEANDILNEIYPDFDKFPTIHRSVCKTCNGNIIFFEPEFIYQEDRQFEFHNKNCIRKQKLEKLNGKI